MNFVKDISEHWQLKYISLLRMNKIYEFKNEQNCPFNLGYILEILRLYHIYIFCFGKIWW